MSRAILVAAALAVSTVPAAAQGRYIDGIFIHAGESPIELLTYADRVRSGQLRISAGSFEDVPVVSSISRVLCSLPNWAPAAVWLSTREIFRDELAERRTLTFAVRRLNVYALELRIADMESAESVSRLVRGVGATEDNPALLFVTMASSGITRHYVVQIELTPPK